MIYALLYFFYIVMKELEETKKELYPPNKSYP